MATPAQAPAPLDALLTALRSAGLAIGPRELLRLHQVFAAEPGPAPAHAEPADPHEHRRRLRAILRAVLLHRAEDGARFDDVFDTWYPAALAELHPPRRGPAPRQGPPPDPPRPSPHTPPPSLQPAAPQPATPGPRPRRLWPWLLALLALELLLGAALRIWPPEPILDPTLLAPVQAPEPPLESPETQPGEVPDTYTTLVPEIRIQPPPPDWQRWRGWPPLALALLGIGAALWARQRVANRSWLPVPGLGAADAGGPPRHYLPAPAGGAGLLLTPAEQGHLVWGIGRCVTATPSRRLDLPASVRATAGAGGLVMPRFAATSRHREVWLWTDSSSADGQAGRLADALEQLLTRHGLRVERAEFRGLPERLQDADGRAVGPAELEDRRAGALVCILGDGRLLLHRYRDAGAARLRTRALLRLLAHWPRLAWVDLGGGDGALGKLLAAHGLACIQPAELIDFLVSPDGSPRRRAHPRRHPAARDRALRLWAAACALPPAPIEEGHALALRQALGLDCPPWDIPALRYGGAGAAAGAAAGASPGGRLGWPQARRLELLRWLAGLDADGAGTGPLQRALRFWDRHYAALLGAEPAADTAARRRLRAEQALLRLWRPAPATAIRTLGTLHDADPPGGAIRSLIRGELGRLAPADAPAADTEPCLRLPWRRAGLGSAERLILHQLGLGADCARQPGSAEGARRPGRHWLGLGLAAGLAAGALAAALGSSAPPRLGAPEVTHTGAGREPPRERLEPIGAERWRLTTLTPDQLAHAADIPAGARVRVSWAPRPRPCIEPLPGGAELHRCAAVGAAAAPPAADIGPAHRRLAVLAANPDGAGVRPLAEALLAGGSAHQVLIDPAWPAARGALTGPGERLHPEDRLLLLTPAPETPEPPADPTWRGEAAEALWLTVTDWSRLAPALADAGSGTCRPAAAFWGQQARARTGDPTAFPLGGTGGGCRPGRWTDPASGIDYIALCGSEFLLGSPQDEPGRFEDEGPRHRVRIGPFLLARTETTNAQYRRLHPDHAGADDLPATSVDWTAAEAFCTAVGGRLPTEAEWEYAARAGTDTPWSFGDNEARLGDHAWYSENSDGKAHPVATREPNPWGLYDMHGNAWEWVADWYAERYPNDAEIRVNPTGPASGSSRVLRGGAFFVGAQYLRSAGRGGGGPEYRGLFTGFRCARAPRRR
jgi:hypothetical protein